MRAMHESQLHQDNCVITLTYERMPKNGSLNTEDFTLFMKRLRKHFQPKKIRFLQCGEYGDKLGRPHHHAALFGIDFDDKIEFKKDDKSVLWTSEILQKKWRHGQCTVGELTFESAAYIARYISKKVYGETKECHYTRVNEETGEVITIKPEYITMSRNPGLASDYYKKYSKDVFPSDNIAVRGKLVKPPKFYLSQLEKKDPQLYAAVKKTRTKTAKENASENTYDRLLVKETVKKAQIKSLTRDLDKGLNYESKNILDL